MLESIYEVLFFSSLRIGNILFDLILPIVLVIVIYDGVFRLIAKLNYMQVFRRKTKNIILNGSARIILLYAFVFISAGIYNLGVYIADYWLIPVIFLALLFITMAKYVMIRFSPRKRRQPSASEIANQAEVFRRIRK